MTDLRQAAQQALEALEGLWENGGVVVWKPDCSNEPRKAITALKAALEQQQAEPSQWRDMVVVSLVREGINKHRARELADHFATTPQQAEPPPPEWSLIKNIIAEYGLDAIAFVAEWKAAQRQWVGLTPEEILDLFDRNNVYGSKWIDFARTVEAKLKEKNDY